MPRSSSNLWATLILAVIMVFVLSAVSAEARMGHSYSHSSGSSSSHSSSSSSSHSSSGSSTHYGGSSGAVCFPCGSIGGIIVVIIVILILYAVMKGGGSGNDGVYEDDEDSPPMAASYDVNPNALEKILQSDPNFTESAFLSKVSNMYVQLQEAWMQKDWKKARPFMTNEMFSTVQKQMQDLIDSKTTNMITDLAVLQTKITDFYQDGQHDIIKVYLKTRAKDYVVRDDNKELVEGDPELDTYVEYIWNLIRKKGSVTDLTKDRGSVTSCPNCGANMSIAASGECEYCGSVVTTGDHDWVLSSYTVLGQFED
ncbi:MAG: TIM44-like domain-containing protein [Acidobacteriota bacterium]